MNSTPRGARTKDVLGATHYARLRRAAAGAIGANRVRERAPTRFGLIICATLATQAAAQQINELLLRQRKKHPLRVLSLAEKERFELSRRDNRPTPLAGAPLRPLEYFSVYSSQVAVCRNLRLDYYTLFLCLCQAFFYLFSIFFYYHLFLSFNPLTHARKLYIINLMILCNISLYLR